VIVEGANVFFDDTARGVIARETGILQIRDSSANKGGVTSSAIAEVLTAFLLGGRYDRMLADPRQRSDLVRAVLQLISRNAVAETALLLALREQTGTPLYQLSVQTSEQLLALQDRLYAHLPGLLADPALVAAITGAYVPGVLQEWLAWSASSRCSADPSCVRTGTRSSPRSWPPWLSTIVPWTGRATWRSWTATHWRRSGERSGRRLVEGPEPFGLAIDAPRLSR